MLFSQVVGQLPLKTKMAEMIQAGKFPHAMLLAGPTGYGALPVALAAAQYLHCENRKGLDACNVCPSCLKHQELVHPDLYFTYPVVKPEKKKDPPVSTDYIKEWRTAVRNDPYMSYDDWMQHIEAENRQGNITADECRQMIHHFNLKAFESAYKIQIIWLAEFLGNEGNILLKLIEEPPGDAVFFLLTEHMDAMLNTIRSRTQIIRLPPIDDSDLAAALSAQHGIEQATAQRAARIADGSYEVALRLAEGEENVNDRLLHQWLVACFNLRHKPSGTNTQDLLDWIETMAKAGRENQKVFIKYALFFLRECSMILHAGATDKLGGDELLFAQRFSARLQYEQIASLQELLNKMYYHIERNANPKVLFLSNSFKIAAILNNEKVAQ